METMIIGLIGVSAAIYLLQRGLKAFGGKTGCSCSDNCCRSSRCSGEDAVLKK